MIKQRHPAIWNKKPPWIFECSWEVCNQVGGIHTVIKTKTPAMISRYGDRFILIGPYAGEDIDYELDYTAQVHDPINEEVEKLKTKGWHIRDAHWQIDGNPRVLLFDVASIGDIRNQIKYELWKEHGIESHQNKKVVDEAIAFGFMVKTFLANLRIRFSDTSIIAHFHEWQSGIPILFLKSEDIKVKTVFTTHATVIGRHLAYNSPSFHEHMPFFDTEFEARHFNVIAEEKIERLSAKYANKLTTVSPVTARECKHLLKRESDGILPNGIDISQYGSESKVQNLHSQFKEDIHRFVMGHFFHSYPFNLDKTLYLFTAGRYEFRNKGFELSLRALEVLNHRLKKAKSDLTIVFFLITRKPHIGLQSEVLGSRAMMEEIRQNCHSIGDMLTKPLIYASAAAKNLGFPNLNNFVDEYWRLRYRRTLRTWRSKKMPSVVTHNLVDASHDEVLNYLKASSLDNSPDQRVKIIYHPEFVKTSPLLGIEYSEFVRGCHLGIFPSYYEPWGYTPLECMASGVQSVTSDLAGFGDYVLQNLKDPEEQGLYVVKRKRKPLSTSVSQLGSILFNFVNQKPNQRILMRSRTEAASSMFDWNYLLSFYDTLYKSIKLV